MLERAGRLDRGQRRGDLSARGPGWFMAKGRVRQGRPFQRRFHLHGQRHPLHHQGSDALRDRAGLAGGREGAGPIARDAGREDPIVSVLGVAEKVTWQQTAEGLLVTVPTNRVSPYTCALKIAGDNLKPAPIPEIFTVVDPDAQGMLRVAT